MVKHISFLWHKAISKTKRDPDEYINQFFRKQGLQIGKHCHIYSNILTVEPFLIQIGDNVTISSNVTFITHDNSIIKIDPKLPNLYGEIIVGNNCFIGANTTLLYGVTLSDNIIVAAGSVVTKSFKEERMIIGGNPAKKIGTWDSFYERYKECGLGRTNAQQIIKEHPEKLVKRKDK